MVHKIVGKNVAGLLASLQVLDMLLGTLAQAPGGLTNIDSLLANVLAI